MLIGVADSGVHGQKGKLQILKRRNGKWVLSLGLDLAVPMRADKFQWT